MATVQQIWECLEAADNLARERPPKSRETVDLALSLLGEVVEPPQDLTAFAAQINGTAYRANGDHAAAEACYTRAEALYREGLANYQDFNLRRRLYLGRADLQRRWSLLCMERLNWSRGIKMLELAKERFILAGQRHEVGRVYLAWGQLLWQRGKAGDHAAAVELLSRAVEMIDPDQREGAFRSAEHNLTCALALSEEVSPESLEHAFEHLQRGRLSRASRRPSRDHLSRQRFGRAEASLPDATRRYLQGRILLRLWQHEDARRFLESARDHFLELGNDPRNVFAVTLDLAECYLWTFVHPWQKVAKLLADTFDRCPPSELTPETQAALELFESALQRRDLASARKQLDATRRRFLAGS
jgi:tetratricopeptide (TPR) repeat protein